MRKQDREIHIQKQVNELFAKYREKMLQNRDNVSWRGFDSKLRQICGSSQEVKKYAVSAGDKYPDVLAEYAQEYGWTHGTLR
jgi:hypothetical protein